MPSLKATTVLSCACVQACASGRRAIIVGTSLYAMRGLSPSRPGAMLPTTPASLWKAATSAKVESFAVWLVARARPAPWPE
jgi:hypothetical protein